MNRGRAEITEFVRATSDRNHNQPPLPGVYPDYAAPVVLNGEDGARTMRDMRWGMPSPKNVVLDAAKKRANKLRAKGGAVDFAELLRMEPDKGVTNIRNVASAHWRPWLGPKNRCLVPFTSFSEPDQVGGSLTQIWFAFDDKRPPAVFAGVWTPWSSVRKVKEGMVDLEVFGILTTEANADVATYHAKAMPVILTDAAERDLWLSDAPWPEVAHLQRPLSDGALKVVATGVKEDETIPG
ncbi:MAG: SOS response-associated peptidase family protein [Caulobacteraceae bacterium]|nr:SOS response-associated peptidase family protein [Caulobacteraceae bacterium]